MLFDRLVSGAYDLLKAGEGEAFTPDFGTTFEEYQEPILQQGTRAEARDPRLRSFDLWVALVHAKRACQHLSSRDAGGDRVSDEKHAGVGPLPAPVESAPAPPTPTPAPSLWHIMKATLRRAVEFLGGGTAYFVRYASTTNIPDDWTLPKELDSRVMFHIVRVDAGFELNTYWPSKEAFDRDGRILTASLTLGAPVVQGYLERLHTPKAWAKVASVSTWILGIVAVLGALEALRNHYDTFFQAPGLTCRLDPAAKTDAVAGSPFRFEVLVANDTMVDHRNLQFVASAPVDAGVTLSLSERAVATLRSGEVRKLTVGGAGLHPGRYELQVAATSAAGRFRFAATEEARVNLVVWDRMPIVRFMVAKKSEVSLRLDGMIRIGAPAPNGLVCDVEAHGALPVADVQDAVVTMDLGHVKSGPWRSAGTGENRVGAFQWTTTPLNGFQEVPFRLLFDLGAAGNWDSVLRDLAITCAERTEP